MPRTEIAATTASEAIRGYALSSMPGAVVDLMDPASIDAFAGRFLCSGGALHILVNNAGIMANPLNRDARGYESEELRAYGAQMKTVDPLSIRLGT
jgi:NAD(P)-dependent dehydrogenase (short-subunit alcohol dehydrogenase family)